jgi:hypothetical protein
MMPSKKQAEEPAALPRHNRPPGYTPERETAEELNVAVRTLRKWRQLQIGPPWTTVGRQIFYGDEDRAAWLKSRRVQPIREVA